MSASPVPTGLMVRWGVSAPKMLPPLLSITAPRCHEYSNIGLPVAVTSNDAMAPTFTVWLAGDMVTFGNTQGGPFTKRIPRKTVLAPEPVTRGLNADPAPASVT